MSTPDPQASRPAYTDPQLTAYLTHISLSPATSVDSFMATCTSSPLGSLEKLLRFHLSAVPFDSLALHYSQHHTVSLHPETLFEKIVGDVGGGGNRGGKRGGYCMENNTFFAGILRGLGYEVLTTGARISNAVNGIFDGGWGGWSHEVLLVKIKGKRYMVDVGFGPQGPIRPLPLEQDLESPGIGSASFRLIHDSISSHTDLSQRLWIYQSRETPDGNWLTNYCFSELEFLPQDFEVMSFRTSQSRTSWFTRRVICVRFLLDEGGKEIVGTLTLAGSEVKRRVRGDTETLAELKSERERVEALERWFEIRLRGEEVEGIRGMVSEIK